MSRNYLRCRYKFDKVAEHEGILPMLACVLYLTIHFFENLAHDYTLSIKTSSFFALGFISSRFSTLYRSNFHRNPCIFNINLKKPVRYSRPQLFKEIRYSCMILYYFYLTEAGESTLLHLVVMVTTLSLFFHDILRSRFRRIIE